jgi:glutamine transport system permease protein
MDFQWSVVTSSVPSLINGAMVTLIIAFLGLAAGITLGIVLGICRAYAHPGLNFFSQCYVELIRGTPMVVQVMFLYFALPSLIHFRIDGIHAGIIAIALNSGAYVSEVVRGTLLSVNRGLSEAGLALGLPFYKVLAFVIGPLAFRRLIPPLGNQCVISLKDTSIFIVIGVGELTRQGQEIMAGNFRAVEIWSSVACFYLLMTGSITLILRLIERKMKIL